MNKTQKMEGKKNSLNTSPVTVRDRNTRTIYEKQSINHKVNPRDMDLHGSARLPTSTGDSRRSLLLEIPTRVQALTVSLVLSQYSP